MKKAVDLGICSAVVFSGAFTGTANAACTSTAPATGASVVCSGTGIVPVAALTGSTGVNITIDSTVAAALTRASSPVSFNVARSSTITSSGALTLTGGGGSGTNRGAVLLGTGDTNRITNALSGKIVTTGAYNDGMAANGSGNSLVNNGSISTAGPNAYGMSAAWGQTNVGQANNTLTNAGTITTSGSNARAASIVGGSGTINNSGTLTTSGANSPTAYLQGNNDSLVNTGTITATGADSDAVFSNTAGSSFAATIENRAGGKIFSQSAAAVRTLNGASTVTNAGLLQSGGPLAIAMGNGVNTLILQTGSQIIGGADGGGGPGASTVILQGRGEASNAFTRFQTLRMAGDAWTFSGTGDFNLAEVQAGTLNLTGQFAPTTVALVDAPGTLQATAQNLPTNVTDNGLVRLAQDIDGTYSGTISGTGAVNKTGAGVLTLTPAAAGGNTYSGGTAVLGGSLAIGADNALGAPTGGLTLDGGTLRLNNALDLAATRPIVLGAAGGVIDTQNFDTTIEQNISGAGSLTKLGAGQLLLQAPTTFTGGTTLVAGTLAVGDSSHAGASLGGGGPVSIAAGTNLGGYGTISGDVTNNGTIFAANALPAFASAGTGALNVRGQLTNNGLAQIAGPGVGNQLVVTGNYIGQNARIALNTVVGLDNSASDKLVVSGGSASGSSTLLINNVGGTGAATAADGIQVVQATNGATSAAGAFSLPASIKAGAYTYYLAKGGVTAGTSESWYLRNTVAAAAPPITPIPPITPPGTPGTPTSPGTPTTPTTPGTPSEPTTPGTPGTPSGTTPPSESAPGPGPIAAPGTPPLPAAPAAGSAPIPLYRPEVALYAAIPMVARELGFQQIDNFHDRQGDQSLLNETGALPAAWGRVWGAHSVQSQDGAANPEFDGSVFGAQAGHDIYADSSPSGHKNHYGLFIGFARATGDVDGFALGFPNVDVGHLSMNAYSLGGYWTHVGPTGWYTDAVLMGSSITVDPLSSQGTGAGTHGTAVTGSVEGGFPIALGNALVVEPQAQIMWQNLSLNDFNDGVSSVSFNNGNTYIGRLGVRLQQTFSGAGVKWQPYARVSVLRAFGEGDSTTFGGTTVIPGGIGQTSGQLNVGLVAQVTRSGSAFVTASYLTNLGGSHQRTIGGNAGVRWKW
ncbi:transporter [Burkholderia sp. Leaf177]|uniref:autotransporter outer membrane beta-barrel domain-containing protein n=1 Tax=Burkholderia sp. Leaf177 TaxID=1736287 RepID=UPI0006F5528B|nr:autotransporter outer membrane beta-barrel domain-containing protein [Burkholderia sp. Leaf177]KQR74758.1 transporter [Burkholderia sp. Leaf177]